MSPTVTGNGDAHSGFRDDRGLVAYTELGEGHQTFRETDCASSFRGNGGGGIGANIVAHALRSEGADASEQGTRRGTPLVAYAIQERAGAESEKDGPQGKGWKDGTAFTLEARHHVQSTASRYGVRRLTPKECERLQGFADDWTAGHSDSARYRMIGNAVAVPVARWIGERIIATEGKP